MPEMFNPIKPRLCSPKEVARLLGVEQSTVYAWISRGDMRSLKVGHRRSISPDNIREFHEKRRNGEYMDLTYAKGPAMNVGYHA